MTNIITNDKLQSIIASKNADLERQALNRASQIINNIAAQQSIIAAANADIVALRAELTTLQVTQLDAAAILGS